MIPARLRCSHSAPGFANLCSSLLTGPSLGEVFIKLVFYASHFQLGLFLGGGGGGGDEVPENSWE